MNIIPIFFHNVSKIESNIRNPVKCKSGPNIKKSVLHLQDCFDAFALNIPGTWLLRISVLQFSLVCIFKN